MLPIALSHIFISIITIIIIKQFSFAKKLQKRIFNFLKFYVFHLAYSCFKFWFSNNYSIVYSRELDNLRNSHSITISNHVSDYDWLYIASMKEKLNRFPNLVITMKESLRNTPLIGYILESFNFIFLSRNIKDQNKVIAQSSLKNIPFIGNILESLKSIFVPNKVDNLDDIEKLELRCQEITNDGNTIDVLLFLEGTYMCKEKQQEALKFYDQLVKDGKATDLNYFNPEYVLIPRVRGFLHLLLSIPSIRNICDITLFTTPYTKFVFDDYPYKDVLITRSKEFGVNMLIEYPPIPDEILNLLKTLKNSELKGTDEYKTAFEDFTVKTTQFLNSLFEKKQNRIKAFANHKKTIKTSEDFAKFCDEIFKSENNTANYGKIFTSINSPYRNIFYTAPMLVFIGMLMLIFYIYGYSYNVTNIVNPPIEVESLVNA